MWASGGPFGTGTVVGGNRAEVRALGSGSAGVLQRVTATALRREDLLPVRPRDRLRLHEPVQACVRGDVSRDVDRALPGDEIRRHIRLDQLGIVLRHGILAGELDLVVDDVEDRRLLEALGTSLGKRRVEVRADGSRRPSRRKRVTARALVLEDLPPVLLVGGRVADGAAGAARGQQQSDSHPPDGG